MPSPVTAVLLGTLGLALLAAWTPLTYLTGDVQVSRDGAAVVLAVGTGLLGLLVARRQPGNSDGWLLLGLAASVIAVVDSGLYTVLGCRMHHGRLPLGEAAVFTRGARIRSDPHRRQAAPRPGGRRDSLPRAG